jgi:pimeloyl-ACP methyl ester carboxylesterase
MTMSARLHLETTNVSIDDKLVEVGICLAPRPRNTILLLHEALGSVSYWRNFPEKLASATESDVLCYSRPGHGYSEGPLETRDRDHYLHQIEVVIPSLLKAFGLDHPVIYGHSEGAGIAMLYAACSRDVKAIVLESPYVVPDVSAFHHIQRLAAAYPGSKMQERLTLYHRDADAVFHSWIHWATSSPHGNYFPEDLLSAIECPVLVLQGANDDFGTTAHLQALHDSIPLLDFELFPDSGHLPHRENTDLLLARVARFVEQLDFPVHQRASTQQSTAHPSVSDKEQL